MRHGRIQSSILQMWRCLHSHRIDGAVTTDLATQRDNQEGDAFGLWGKRKVDGLAYQEKARREW
jgi:hypothetical protein